MAKKKLRSRLGKAFLNTLLLIPNLFSFFGDTVSLVKEETKLAGRSMITLLALGFFVISLLTSCWLILEAMLYLYFVSQLISPLLSLSIVLLCNLLLICVTFLFIQRAKRNMTFPETRDLIQSALHLD